MIHRADKSQYTAIPSQTMTPPMWAFIAIALAPLLLATGCEPLHRDIDPVWNDDAGIADTGTDTNGSQDCTPGDRCGPCDQGSVVCESDGRRVCEGMVDLDNDDDHCGECNNDCSADFDDGQTLCEDGQCIVECSDPDHDYCEDSNLCTDLDSDDDHCGECNNDCSTDIDDTEARCDDGQCITECLDDTHSLCEGYGLCADLDSDNDHCGNCGTRCVGNRECIDGTCIN